MSSTWTAAAAERPAPSTVPIPNCARLIDLVYARDALWNPQSSYYHNREMKHLLWTEISVELGVSRETVRTKWSCLRDSFRRELKKRNDSGLFYKAHWPFFNRMLFLTSAMNPKDCSADQDFYSEPNTNAFEMLVNPEVLMSSNGDTDLLMVSVKEEPTTEPATSTTPKPSASLTSSSNYRFPRGAESSNHLEQLSREKRKLKKIKKRIAKGKQRGEDYHFALSLVSCMSKVPDENKIKMRMHVLDTISSFISNRPDNPDQSTCDNSSQIEGESLSGTDVRQASPSQDDQQPVFTINKIESDESRN